MPENFAAIPVDGIIGAQQCEDLSLAQLGYMLILFGVADHWGRLTGSYKGLAARLRKPSEAVEAMVQTVQDAGLVRRYHVQPEGQTFKIWVIEIVDFPNYPGHAKSRAIEGERGAPEWPDDKGKFPPHRPHKKGETPQTQTPTQPAKPTGQPPKPAKAPSPGRDNIAATGDSQTSVVGDNGANDGRRIGEEAAKDGRPWGAPEQIRSKQILGHQGQGDADQDASLRDAASGSGAPAGASPSAPANETTPTPQHTTNMPPWSALGRNDPEPKWYARLYAGPPTRMGPFYAEACRLEPSRFGFDEGQGDCRHEAEKLEYAARPQAERDAIEAKVERQRLESEALRERLRAEAGKPKVQTRTAPSPKDTEDQATVLERARAKLAQTEAEENAAKLPWPSEALESRCEPMVASFARVGARKPSVVSRIIGDLMARAGVDLAERALDRLDAMGDSWEGWRKQDPWEPVTKLLADAAKPALAPVPDP